MGLLNLRAPENIRYESATNAIAQLFWGGHNTDALPINRWKESASILGVVNAYFDAERKRLRTDLEYRDKRPSEEFEEAVVWLLNILGIPTIWYGKTVMTERMRWVLLSLTKRHWR